MKKRIYICFLILNTVLTLTLLLFTGIIRTLVDIYLPLGALLILPMIIIPVYICGVILIGIGILTIPKRRVRILSTILFLSVVVLALVFPYTKAYGIANYKLNYDLRAEFVDSVDDVKQNYPQIDVGTYFVKDIRLSYSGSVTAEEADGGTLVMFDVYYGFFGNTVLIYSSVPKEISFIDFGNGGSSDAYLKSIKSITKINDHWYYAVL